MKQGIQLKRRALAAKHPINRLHLLCGRLVIALPLGLACLTLSPTAQASTDGDLGNGNTAEGSGALFSLTSGPYNTAMGFQALYSNNTGGYNTANGFSALFSNSTASYNVANGFGALYSNTQGYYNTATGVDALYSNTTASYNTANGDFALFSNTSGGDNTATGFQALYSNTTGSLNTATGFNALYHNTSGSYNTANGVDALFSNTTGNTNIANGDYALFNNSTGFENTVTGVNAVYSNTTGYENTATGVSALSRNTTGSDNIALGYLAGSNLTTGSNNIDIGNNGVGGEANTIRIGSTGTQSATFIAGISGTAVAGNSVVVDANGQLGTIASSERFKEEIKPMDKASEAILALRPVSFRYKHEIDPEGIAQFGLIAEEVEKLNPDLVARDAQGKVYTVRYEAVNAMLLNEFLKQHRKVQEQEETIKQLRCIVGKQEATIAQHQKELQSTAAQRQEEIQALAARLKDQESQIQKVTAQLEVSLPRRAPQVVDNNE